MQLLYVIDLNLIGAEGPTLLRYPTEVELIAVGRFVHSVNYL
jgi:hypothetical protein